MKKFSAFLCSFFMALAGIGFAIGTSEPSNSVSYKTLNAAPVLHWAPNATLPLDLKLDLEKKYTNSNDTKELEVIHDTIYKDKIVHDTIYKDKIVYKYRTRKVSSTIPRAEAKRLGDSIPAIIPDTFVADVDVGREEHPTDTIGPPKESIILTVGGEVVYKRQ